MTRPTFELATMDAVDFLMRLDAESVACIVTDPAYESLEKHRAHGTTTRLKQSAGSSNPWFGIFRNSRWPDLMAESFRVLAPNGHMYVLADEETTYEVTKPTAVAAGFTWWRALTWVKTTHDAPRYEVDLLEPEHIRAGMGFHWRGASERIAFLEKGKRRLNHLGWPDVLPAPRVTKAWDGEGQPYPTEKPVSLLARLIENSTNPGELVVDPFLGSGSTGEAALTGGRLFAGCDVAAAAVDRAHLRLERFGTAGLVTRARKQGELFG